MYTVDGLPPVDPAGVYKLLVGTGVRGLSGRRSSMVELPGADGVLPDLGSAYAPGGLQLRYRIYAQTHGAFMLALEKLNGIFGQRRRLLPVVHDYGNGQTRLNDAEVLDAVQPDVVLCTYAYYVVTLHFPSPFWRGATVVTAATPALTTTTTTHTLTTLASTGPIVDALVRIKGAFSTAVVTNPVTGDRLTVNTAVTATNYVLIDCANWTATRLTSNVWTGGTDVSALVDSNRGQGPMFILEPDSLGTGGRFQVAVSATNPATSPVVEVRARQSYL